jgi:hypothetical protein
MPYLTPDALPEPAVNTYGHPCSEDVQGLVCIARDGFKMGMHADRGAGLVWLERDGTAVTLAASGGTVFIMIMRMKSLHSDGRVHALS